MKYNPTEKRICLTDCCNNEVKGKQGKKYCNNKCRDKTKKRRKRGTKPTAYREEIKIKPKHDTYATPSDFPPPMVFDYNKPQRYTKGKIECIEAIKSAVTGKRPEEAVMVGNIIKYLWRYESKGGLEDIEKAEVYLKFLKEEYNSNKKE